jgi:hypothetical protein
MKVMPIAEKIWEDPEYQKFVKTMSGKASWPYLKAMLMDDYGHDEKRDVVNYFLANAAHYRGEVARECKQKLKEEMRNG